MTESIVVENELVKIEKIQALDIFTKRELITPLLEKIEYQATKETLSAKTDKGRKAIASLAYQVAQSKTYIEAHGKELAAELKELPKLVDSNRKYARDFLDELKARIRKPLDDWESEQEAIKLKEEIERLHEEALLLNTEWELSRIENEKKAQLERKEIEERIRKEAEEKAKKEAEEKARKEIIQAEARALAAENEAKRVAEHALAQAELAAKKAVEEQKKEQLEIQRLAQEEKDREAIKRKQKDHIEKINQSIIDDLLSVGLNNKQAEYILNAVCSGKIRALKIEY